MVFSVSQVDSSLGVEGKAWGTLTKNKELRGRESIGPYIRYPPDGRTNDRKPIDRH